MPHTSEINASTGIVNIDPTTLAEGQVHYQVHDGVLMLTKVSETGLGTHTRFIHDVPGLPTPKTSRNAGQAEKQSHTPRSANRQYRESQANVFSPPDSSPDRSFNSTSSSDDSHDDDDDDDMDTSTTPATPRANRTADGAQTTPGGKPLIRSPPIVLNAPSLGDRAEAWIAEKMERNAAAAATRSPLRSKGRTTGPAINGTWDNVLESLPMAAVSIGKRRSDEQKIRDREWENLQMDHELTWELVECDVRRIEGLETEDSEMDDSECSSAGDEEKMEYGDSEEVIEAQLPVRRATEDDMEGLYIDADDDHHSSAGGTPHPSFASNNSSINSIFRDQFGTFYHTFTPMPSPAPIPEDSSVEGDLRQEVRRAIEEQGDKFYHLSTSDLSTSSSASEVRFRGFHPNSRVGRSSPAPSPVAVNGSARVPSNLMRFVTPDNVALNDPREVPPAPAPTRVRAYNPNLRDQLYSSQDSSAFEPTPGLTPRQAEKYLPHRDELDEARGMSGGPDRRKKAVRWRDPTPLPSRDATPVHDPFPAESFGSHRAPMTHAERRLELQRKLYGTRAPELKKRGKILLRPASEVLAESGASTEIDTDADNTPNTSFSGQNMRAVPQSPVAGPSGVARTDSLKENVKPLSSLSPGRVPFQPILQTISAGEAPVLSPVHVVPIEIVDATPKTPGSSSRSRRRVSDVTTSPMLTRSKARANGNDQAGATPRSSGKGKGRA